jgi:non-heme chloroperoxidase
MKNSGFAIFALYLLLCPSSYAQTGAKSTDNSPHTIQFVTVEDGVKLEVVDWGGTGRPLILLAGLGSDAHVFDQFASRLIPSYHVYGITRRGFGASSAPNPDCANYSADRLGDDVLSVMNALKIERPVLIGHSIAGEELSSIGTRFPGRVAGLVYLEAGYPYAFYDESPNRMNANIVDIEELRMELDGAATPASVHEQKEKIRHLLEVSLPRIANDLRDGLQQLADVPDSTPAPPDTSALRINVAIMKGVGIYRGVNCPVLAIFADPHNVGPRGPTDPEKKAAMIARDEAQTTIQANAFRAGNPSARVVLIANADHFVFISHEADVLRELNAFLTKLP